MPLNRHGMPTASCVLPVSSQSETTPSTWRTGNHIVSKVSDNGASFAGLLLSFKIIVETNKIMQSKELIHGVVILSLLSISRCHDLFMQ